MSTTRRAARAIKEATAAVVLTYWSVLAVGGLVRTPPMDLWL